MKKLLVILTLLWGGGAVGFWYWNNTHGQRVTFRTVKVTRGDLQASVHATATLEPEEVVDVGAQIAGEIESFGKDPDDPSRPIGYGSKVEEGTVLAHLDASLFKARVEQARASLKRAEADVLQAQAKLRQLERDLQRVQKLQSSRMVSEQEYDSVLAGFETAQANLAVSESSVALAQANLQEATVNLGYTTIRSPVKGVILDRRVNIGQTVVASLNVPSLFLIAKDLSRMKIWASVNENDVGVIHVGQPVRFTLGAFPDETFRGRVEQIRLNASMVQNVVTYTVVADVDNTSGKLLPYLTAKVQFEVDERKNVLLVPSSALRWRPRIQHVAPWARGEFANSTRRIASDREVGKPASTSVRPSNSQGTLWVRSGEFVRPVKVEVGLTDIVMTEISSNELHEGSEVVVGLEKGDEHEQASTPFLPQLKNDKAKR